MTRLTYPLITMILLILTFVAMPLLAAEAEPVRAVKAQPKGMVADDARKQVEVCFVLDTTGSMGGLIAGAKAKIWAIANQIIATEPRPEVKFSLIAYRDRGDEYITQVHDLTADIDKVYAELQKFQATGGGDGPESVNQALHEAVTKVNWSESRDVYKVIFLVGDAPPHMDYEQDIKYPQTCEMAVKKDLIINTVQCGNMGSTTPIWQEIAELSEGKYVQIQQSGGVRVVETPMDAKLAELNRKLGTTLVAYGSAARRNEVMAKQAASEATDAPAAAERAVFVGKTGKGTLGGGDLVDDYEADADTLAEVESAELPEELQKLSKEELKAHLEKKAEQRAEIQKQINELARKRQAYIDKEMKRLAEEGEGDGFDVQVREMIVEQASAKGLKYED